MIAVFVVFLFAPSDPTAALIAKVAASGRVVELATPLSERVTSPPQIAPGAPPVLSFRLLEGQLRNRFGGSDLVLDDAGH